MADVDLRLVSDMSKMVQGFRDVQGASTRFHEDMKARQQELKKEIKETSDWIKQLEREIKKADKAGVPSGKRKEQLRDARKLQSELTEAMQDTTNEIGRADKKQKLFSKTLGRFLGVGALVVTAYKSLKSVIASTGDSAAAFERTMDGLKASLDVLKKSLATGDFENFGNRMREARKAAQDYSDGMRELNHAERALAVQRAERAEELYELDRRMRATENTTHAERQKAMDDYMAIQRMFFEQEKAIADKRLELTADLVVSKTKLESKELQDLIKFYNENKELSEAALEYDLIINKKTEALENARANTTKAIYGALGNYLFSWVVSKATISEKDIEKAKDNHKEEVKIYRERLENTSRFTEEQLAQHAAYLKQFGIATNEELQMVADAMKAKEDAYAAEKRLESTKQRVQNTIDRAARVQREKEQAALKKLQDDWLKSEDAYLRRIAEMRKANQLENIKDQEEEQQIIQQLVFERGELMKLEIQLLEERRKKAKEAFEGGAITKAEYEQILGVDSIKEVQDAIEILTLQANARLAQIRQDAAQSEQAENEADAQTIMAEQRKFLEEELNFINASEKEKLELKLKFLEEDKANLTHQNAEVLAIMEDNLDLQILLLRRKIDALKDEGEKFDLMEWLGISSEQLSAGKTAVREVTKVLNDIFSERVKDAERTRSLLDRQIQETQNALNAELALLEAGYASNVRAKQEEVERLQAEREKALEAEEKALEQQRTFDTIQQSVSLITASANIFKALSPLGVAGYAIAGGLVAAMFASFVKAKQDAEKATKMEMGGLIDEYGTVRGKRHSQGGERMLDHVEVEDGEKIAVFNRMASRKFDKEIRSMVEQFNAGEIPYFKYMPNMPIQVNAFADTKKLHDIDKKLATLNGYFANSMQITHGNGYRVEKSRNSTRVVYG